MSSVEQTGTICTAGARSCGFLFDNVPRSAILPAPHLPRSDTHALITGINEYSLQGAACACHSMVSSNATMARPDMQTKKELAKDLVLAGCTGHSYRHSERPTLERWCRWIKRRERIRVYAILCRSRDHTELQLFVDQPRWDDLHV